MEFQFISDGNPSAFFFLSAMEDREPATHADWRKADQLLRNGLKSAGLRTFRVVVVGDDDTRAQPGWAVVACEELVMALAERFAVAKVIHLTREHVTQIDRKTMARETLPAEQVRCTDPRRVKHFVLFVGSRPGETHDPQSTDRLRSIVRKRFAGFTLSKAEGWFEGVAEGTVCIHLGTSAHREVLHTAEELRVAFDQIGIGISCNGIYQRVREHSDFDFMLEGFGLS